MFFIQRFNFFNLYFEEVVLAGQLARADWIVIGFKVSFNIESPLF
jgi:hypothetical protein